MGLRSIIRALRHRFIPPGNRGPLETEYRQDGSAPDPLGPQLDQPWLSGGGDGVQADRDGGDLD